MAAKAVRQPALQVIVLVSLAWFFVSYRLSASRLPWCLDPCRTREVPAASVPTLLVTRRLVRRRDNPFLCSFPPASFLSSRPSGSPTSIVQAINLTVPPAVKLYKAHLLAVASRSISLAPFAWHVETTSLTPPALHSLPLHTLYSLSVSRNTARDAARTTTADAMQVCSGSAWHADRGSWHWPIKWSGCAQRRYMTRDEVAELQTVEIVWDTTT